MGLCGLGTARLVPCRSTLDMSVASRVRMDKTIINAAVEVVTGLLGMIVLKCY